MSSLVLLYGCDLDCDLQRAYLWGWEQLGQDKVGVGKTHPWWVTSAPSETPPAAVGGKGKERVPHRRLSLWCGQWCVEL